MEIQLETFCRVDVALKSHIYMQMMVTLFHSKSKVQSAVSVGLVNW